MKFISLLAIYNVVTIVQFGEVVLTLNTNHIEFFEYLWLEVTQIVEKSNFFRIS